MRIVRILYKAVQKDGQSVKFVNILNHDIDQLLDSIFKEEDLCLDRIFVQEIIADDAQSIYHQAKNIIWSVCFLTVSWSLALDGRVHVRETVHKEVD